jgi:hypothetical protein
VSAELAGTNPDKAQGSFSIIYPGHPDVAHDNTYVRGTIRCLAVSGNEARLVGQIGSASGPRAIRTAARLWWRCGAYSEVWITTPETLRLRSHQQMGKLPECS